jgi:hypothetical protein
MKSEFLRLSSSEIDALTASEVVTIQTLILSSNSEKTAFATIYIEKSDGSTSSDFVIFNGNVYPNLNESVYFSKDLQLFLEDGDKIKASARHLDGSDPESNVVDMIISYSGSAAVVSSSSSSTYSASSSSSNYSSSSSSSSNQINFLNYNRSEATLSSHINWGLLRGALYDNLNNWGVN